MNEKVSQLHRTLEAKAREQRAAETRRHAEQQQAVANAQNWQNWIEQCIIERTIDREMFYDVVGSIVARERATTHKETAAAIAEAWRVSDARLEAFERRILERFEIHTELCNKVIIISAVRGDELRKAIEAERADRDKAVKDAGEDAQRDSDAKLEALERRILQHIDEHTEQCNQVIVVSAGRADTLDKAIATERTDRQKEVKAALEEAQRAVEAKLVASEQRIVQHTDQRIMGSDSKDADPEAVARLKREKGG